MTTENTRRSANPFQCSWWPSVPSVVFGVAAYERPRHRRRQHQHGARHLRGRTAGAALAHRDQAGADRRRARGAGARPAARAPTLDRRGDVVRGAGADGHVPRALPQVSRPRPAGGRARASAPACRSCTRRRTRSAATGWSTPWRRTSAPAARRSWSTSAPRPRSSTSPPTGAYAGGVICPGVRIASQALFARAARLTSIELRRPPQTVGRTTVHALQSGIAARPRRRRSTAWCAASSASRASQARVIATGGLCGLLAPESETIDEVDEFLTLDGLRSDLRTQRTAMHAREAAASVPRHRGDGMSEAVGHRRRQHAHRARRLRGHDACCSTGASRPRRGAPKTSTAC